jgi:hypothetical protein
MRMAITDRVLFAESASQASAGASHHLLAGTQLRAAVQWMESRERGSASHEHGSHFRGVAPQCGEGGRGKARALSRRTSYEGMLELEIGSSRLSVVPAGEG